MTTRRSRYESNMTTQSVLLAGANYVFHAAFDAACKALVQAALAALTANGFRPDTNRPGHHATVLQSLPVSIGLEPGRVVMLDALRRKRNLSDDTGEDVDDGSVAQCIEEAESLLQDVERWLARRHPGLIGSRTWRTRRGPSGNAG